jgi:hypothetical protein
MIDQAQSDAAAREKQLREALDDPGLLHWLGSQDVVNCSAAVARAVTAIHDVRAALRDAGGE